MNGLLAENLENYANFDRFYPPPNRGPDPPPSLVYSEKSSDPPPHLDAVNPTFFRKSGSSFQKPPPLLENGHFWKKPQKSRKNAKILQFS